MEKKIIARNKKATHDYYIEETLEAGIVLTGTEVKSLRQGKVNIKESYCIIDKGEIFIINLNISPYEQGNIYNRDPLRKRKLLLNKKEIRKFLGLTTQKGFSIIPLNIYIRDGLVKLEISLAKGKKLYDKRHDIAKKETERRIQRRDY